MDTYQNREQSQLAREELMLASGRERYHSAKARLVESSETGAHRPYLRLTKGALPMVSGRLAEWLEEAQNHGRGRTHTAVPILREMDVDLLAYIGLWSAWTAVSGAHSVQKVCRAIGRHVEGELWASGLRERDPQLFARLALKVSKDNSSARYRLKAMRAIAKAQGYSPDHWQDDQRLKVGEPILDAVIVASGVFALVNNGRNSDTITLTEEAQGVASDMEAVEEWMAPAFTPMVVPPVPWTDQHTGAYLTDRVRSRVPLVRTFDPEHRRMLARAIREGRMERVLTAVNALQETPLRINAFALDLIEFAWENGFEISKFPRKELVPEPGRHPGYDFMEPKEKAAWRRKVGQVREMNRRILSDQLVFKADLHEARALASSPEFYLPHNFDFRGRVYPVPHFNHQRCDYVKAAIEFANPTPVGPEGGYWLSVHLANVGDFEKVSKKPFAARVQWVIDNRDMIESIAEDPFHDLRWLEADKPFQFAVACREWAAWSQQPTSALRDAYESHMVVSVDGANSGLQHYAAALMSRDDGRHVCLTPEEAPADVYQAVADKVNEALEAVAADVPEPAPDGTAMRPSDEQMLAVKWLNFGVDRKVVKRNVMTFPYSSEVFGFRQQLMVDLMLPLREKVLTGELEHFPLGEDGGSAAAGMLSKLVWAAVTETVADAAKGMKFLQRCASLLAHERQPMTWTTPLGFPVLHKYPEWIVKRVNLFLHDRPMDVVYEGDEPPEDRVRRIRANIAMRPASTIKKAKQRSAVAPNVIHSQDATHLLMTVNACAAQGVQDFLMVHDSFGCPVGHMDTLFEVVREEFVRLYGDYDLFGRVRQETLERLSDKGAAKLPDAPPKGSLTLEDMRTALYAFA